MIHLHHRRLGPTTQSRNIGDVCRSCAIISTHGLPCRHTIWRHVQESRPLPINIIHVHWHWERRPAPFDPSHHRIPSLLDPTLPLLDPLPVKGKGRPKGAVAAPPANRRSKNPATDTRRDPSLFEREEASERAEARPADSPDQYEPGTQLPRSSSRLLDNMDVDDEPDDGEFDFDAPVITPEMWAAMEKLAEEMEREEMEGDGEGGDGEGGDGRGVGRRDGRRDAPRTSLREQIISSIYLSFFHILNVSSNHP